MNLLKKPFAYAIIFGFFLASLFSYSLLKTFVLSQAMTSVQSKSTTATSKLSSGQTEQTENSYKDDHLNITLIEKTVENTQVYIADIQTDSADFLKTALANHTYGTNVTAKTSETAAANKAILAVNGDYYGANADGYVIRDGQIYRDSVRQNADNGDLAIYKDGSFKIINENEVTAQELVDQGVVNLLAFGPALIKDEKIKDDIEYRYQRIMNYLRDVGSNSYTAKDKTRKELELAIYDKVNLEGVVQLYRAAAALIEKIMYQGNQFQSILNQNGGKAKEALSERITEVITITSYVVKDIEEMFGNHFAPKAIKHDKGR